MPPNIFNPYRYATPVSEELWSTPSASTVQIGCNGSTWRGAFLQTSATLTGCDDIQYDQIQQEWDYDPYINGSLLIGSAYGY